MEAKATVLSRVCQNALIGMAVSEGLLEEDAQKTDGFLASRMKVPVPDWIREQVLEQLVFAPKIVHIGGEHAAPWLRGRLIDEGLIDFTPGLERAVALESLSLRIIAGMLASEGFAELAQDPMASIEAFNRAERARIEFKERTGKELPKFGPPSSADSSGLDMGRKFFQKNDYTQQEYEEAAPIRKQRKQNAPVRDCITEYELLSTIASEQNALLRTPVLPKAADPSIASLLSPEVSLPAAVRLFRIAVTGLGKLPFRNTLTETLTLARDPATIALRQNIEEWLIAFSNTNEQDLQMISRDIATASEALSRLGHWRVVAAFCTWIALPVGIAEAFLQLPPVLSSSISVVGMAAESRKLLTEKKCRWVRFGNDI